MSGTHRPFSDGAGYTRHCWECANATVTQTVDEKIFVQERFYDTAKVPTLFDFDVD